ncbi:aminodeoxychorismate synthase component I [Noviherbaspirillum sp. ST9]|uniref:aminodeoxychorismate synthase component I n=1 Tax=Noviherbaspirillum sp. ST9 TaxID=3401606 RepID=UPI003B58ADE6
MTASSIPADTCFALLDDVHASENDPRSRLLTGLAGVLPCDSAEALPGVLAEMEAALRQGKHAIGVFSYELGAHMHGIAPREGNRTLAQVLLFERCEHLSSTQVAQWLANHAQHATAGIAAISANVSDAQFEQAIARIHAYIEAGDTYQINYTYRLRFDAFGSPIDLYRRLRERQPVPYGALLMLPDGRTVLSLSPELFVRHAEGIVTTRPMKGTAAASGDAAIDAQRAAALAADTKNRAENLMIVDLLRNDLGRVAKFGTVKVPKLFSVDRYSSVLQMTSTVEAELRDDAGLADVFAALYPCGSITGAPKRRTMQIIRELEPDPRGIYTGAIGWFEAPAAGRKVGDFCLSVPIRTLVLQPPGEDGIRKGEMGVGAGIVHDSIAAEEAAECRLKARFLTGLPNDFELFETMHATREEGCRNWDRHLHRLRTSASYFGFAFDQDKITDDVAQRCTSLEPQTAYRMRLSLRQDGTVSMQAAPIAPLALPVKIFLAPAPTLSTDVFLRHKTSVRTQYDAAWRSAEEQGGFDMLFFNERDELTEGGRSNVFVRLGGQWLTPPLDAGVLPGVMRSVLLADRAWAAHERRLTRDDLRAAEEVVVCNALRGVLPASLVWQDR